MSDRIGVDAVPLRRQDSTGSSGPAHFHFVARMLHSQWLCAGIWLSGQSRPDRV